MTDSEKLKIMLIQGKEIHKTTADKGALLMQVIQESGLSVMAPCGGKGLCGKCRVFIDGKGAVLACTHRLTESCTVLLPSLKKNARIQSDAVSLIQVTAEPGPLLPVEHPLGVSVDIGTTTVVVYLMDLADVTHTDHISFLNPQQEYGHDVISRIQFTIEKKDGLKTLQTKIITAINNGIHTVCKLHKLDPDFIVKAVFAGNTTMLHLLAGENPATIAVAPFTPLFKDLKRLNAETLGLKTNAKAEVILLPSVSGYVGADITAGLAASPIPDADHWSLYLDIGTNGEMALGNKGRILCCSTAAGPAFEGAKITCGIGGIDGAISAFDGVKYETIAREKPIGICGSGLIDIMAHLLDTSVISPEGRMETDFLIAPKAETALGRDIVLTPADVREIQLAKAAIAAGIRVLIKEAGISIKEIEHVFLAGGFGSFISLKSAVRIGLIPGELKKKVRAVGNQAGLGAQNALKSTAFEKKVVSLAARCEYIELSGRQDFSDSYIEEMTF